MYKNSACKYKLSEVGHFYSDCTEKYGTFQTTLNKAPQRDYLTWNLSIIFFREMRYVWFLAQATGNFARLLNLHTDLFINANDTTRP